MNVIEMVQTLFRYNFGDVVLRQYKVIRPILEWCFITKGLARGSFLLDANCVGHDRAAIAKWLVLTDRGVFGSLMLSLGVELSTQEHHAGRNP